jgi:4-amino-4-deoxy-L-arabinose transferase-like glycosyltransferase
VVFGTALFAGVTMLWNIWAAPDTMYDEVSYVTAAQNVAQRGELTWDNAPIFVHPPLSFLAQAGWLRLLGLGAAPLQDAVVAARVFAAGTLVFAILLVGLLAAYLTPKAGRGRGLLLVGLIVGLLACDPILLRYCRMAIIEPFALLAGLLTLCLAVWLRERPASVYVPAVGLATGLALLTKEITIFMVATPLVYALLERDGRLVRRSLGALVAGAAIWASTFMLWPVKLGVWASFTDEKLLLFKRLLGLVQTTGWNRPGFTFAEFLAAVAAAGTEYGPTYLVLAGGGLAMLYLLLHRGGGPATWLLAWLITSYGFAAYMVAFGSLNEHLFTYLLPAAVTGTVLVTDAWLARRAAAREARGRASRMAVLPVALLIGLLAFSAFSWAHSYLPAGDGVFRSAAHLREQTAPCSAVNGIGDAGKWAPLVPGHLVTEFATGPTALSHGVHLYFISGKDARVGNALPELPDWVRAHGTPLRSFPSVSYEGIELWEVPADPYDALADTEPVEGGLFVTTVGSRCGGFPVLDGPGGAFDTAWAALGGKAVTGPPLTRGWATTSGATQVFRGGVLTRRGVADLALMPVVATLAATRPEEYRAAGLPPVTATGGGAVTDQDVLARLTDPGLAAAYLGLPAGTGTAGTAPAGITAPAGAAPAGAAPAGAAPGAEALRRARGRLGDPIGPPTATPGGGARQAFENAVLERPGGGTAVRFAPIGQLAITAGLVTPTIEAATPAAPPAWESDNGPPQPTTVQPFLVLLAAALTVYVALSLLVIQVGRMLRGRR